MLPSLCMSGALGVATAHAQQLRVLTRPSFHAVRTEAHPSGTKVTGTLRDETLAPLPARPVHLDTSGRPGVDCATGELSSLTDSQGRFCFLLRGPAPNRARLRHAAEGYVADSSRTVTLELPPPEVNLQLDVETATWALHGRAQTVRVAVRGADPSEVYALQLSLQRGSEQPRAIAPPSTVSGQSPTELSLEPGRLGAPGPVTLIATLGDEPGQPLAHASVPLVLSAEVELGWPAKLVAVRPELGFDLAFTARAHDAPVDSGRVEVRVGDQVVGTAPVRNGAAVVPSRFVAARQTSVMLSARYVREHPWLEPGPELQQELPIAGVPWWLHAPWVLCGCLAALWIFRAWRRPTRAKADSSVQRPTREPVAGVAVVESEPADRGWRGNVLDLHTGHPIQGARVRIVLPAVSAELTLVEAVSDGVGQFALPPTDQLAEGASWIVEAEEHSTLRRPVPAAGKVVVTMTSRRRTLLQLLVRWGEARGWSKDSTPAELLGAARERGRADVEHWALEIERAAFGPAPPDAPRERSLTQAAPPQDQAGTLER